jgi:hypothetical protein
MGRRRGYGAPTVEQMRSIEIDVFRRAGYVGTPATNWWVYRNRLFCAGIQPRHWNDNAVTLDTQILRITHLPWHFGGQRAYFLCDCERRVGKLYSSPGHPWRCRKCYQLAYATRQASPRQRLILKGQKIRERLGGELGVLCPFPNKPKGMHWRRYDRLRHQHDQAVRDSLGTLTAFANRMASRLAAHTAARGRRS